MDKTTSGLDGNSGNALLQYFGNPAKLDEPQVAYRFSDDGEGLCYYPNGRVAVAVSNLSNGYSKRYYVYDNDKDKVSRDPRCCRVRSDSRCVVCRAFTAGRVCLICLLCYLVLLLPCGTLLCSPTQPN
jgi:hypothetical protein